MILKIATGFNVAEQTEEFTVVEIQENVAVDILKQFFQKMDYAKSAAWVAANKEAVTVLP